MNLKDVRDKIDALDAKIIKLINERMERAILTRKLKPGGIQDSGREAEVLDKVRRNVRSLADADFCLRLYQEIMAESKRLQALDLRTVGFLGDHGSNSELAARAWDPAVVPIPCPEFADIFEGVEQGVYDFGILPVENTLGGMVGPVNNLLIYTGLNVVSAVDMPIAYSLMAAPGTDYREIRKAYSHPQALLQCRGFLARAKLEPVPAADTASAAKMVAEDRPENAAAIANPLCAEIYGLDVIKEGIQDAQVNRTRFFILSREPAPADGGKCSIVFKTENKAGALFRTLQVFAEAGINLTRIESVPDVPGEYAIFIDLVGSLGDAGVGMALDRVRAMTAEFRILGCYDEKYVAG
jgi:prephenate dehydratase/chorismate mutase/prephenate dehydratase